MKYLQLSRMVLGCFLFFLCFSCMTDKSNDGSLTIKVDRNLVQMGRSIQLNAHLKIKSGNPAKDYLLLPYVNQRKWGSQERPDVNGNATFLIPLPNAGKVTIQVVAVKAESGNWMGISDKKKLMAGSFIPDSCLTSNEVEVRVNKRVVPEPVNDGHLFCMQWEPWFLPERGTWNSAEAVPVIGFYDSYNRDAIRQHMLWFMDMGVNCIMPDWSNHMWGKKHWNEVGPGPRAIVHATTCFLDVLAEMQSEGLNVPKVALMPGLSNGSPATMEALNEQLEWIYQNYVLNPRFNGLFQEYGGKPLVIILDTGAIGHKNGTAASAFRVPFFEQTLALSENELDAFRRKQVPIDDSHFTIRFMSSQNQVTLHHELGYWSWMDGQLEPIVTYSEGKPEAITVTPAFFGLYGWTAPEAYGRRGGTTYLESFKFALQSKPRVIFLHQFNEFAGQPEGHGLGKNHDIYLDEHSMEFSDDIEPVSLTAAGLRDSTGGWGFYYLNMTRALMDIFRGKDKNSTLLACYAREITSDSVHLCWSSIGVNPSGYDIAVDDKTIYSGIKGTEYQMPVQGLSKGRHTITVKALGVQTYYALSKTAWDEIPEKPFPVISRLTVEL